MSPDDQLIRPATFKPTRDDGRGQSWLARHRVQMIATSLLLGVAWFVWFIFTAKSVQLVFDPSNATASIERGFDITLGGVYVLREGHYELHARADGYEELVTPLEIGETRNQVFNFKLTPLPGRITFSSEPVSAEVLVDGAPVGNTPLDKIDVAAGEHKVTFRNARYQPQEIAVSIEGKRAEQSFAATLTPNWATITASSTPAGATVLVDDQEVGTTPGSFEIVAGTHDFRLKHAGFKSWRTRLEVVATQDQALQPVALEPADGLINVISRPPGAGVTVNGTYRGETPLEIALSPGTRYDVRITRAGFETARRQVLLSPNEEQTLQVEMAALTGRVAITADPKNAEVFVDGASHGFGSQTLTLPARPQTIEVRLANYATYSTRITPQPGLTQEVNAKLLTVAQARQAAMKPRAIAPNGQELVLLTPGKFTMGSSRREPGRRANEVLRDVTLTRAFYLSTTEVTNAQYKKFDSKHDSGMYEENKLNTDDQPVARVSWLDAALYCNAMSEREHLPLFYTTDGNKVVGINPKATGYRLPTEAEWEWAARTIPGGEAERRFPWGDNFPPPDRSGNYADRSAAHIVGRTIFGYNDNQIVSSPVKTFAADPRGLFDIGGNVAEWANDFYEIPPEQPQRDPLGPESGEYHVIRGSSWMNGTITELRLSFRDYGTDGRPDLGFRVARFAE
jgi:formylglycine-generating enzyme required for sulfatase activity